jgi:hypothetical protein
MHAVAGVRTAAALLQVSRARHCDAQSLKYSQGRARVEAAGAQRCAGGGTSVTVTFGGGGSREG